MSAPERLNISWRPDEPDDGFLEYTLIGRFLNTNVGYRRDDLPPTLAEALKVPEIAALVDAAIDLGQADEAGQCAIPWGLVTKMRAALAAIKDAEGRE
jgi:hypothetical protein